MRNLSKCLWGIVLILIGVVIGLNSLNITSINIFFKGWWTLFIIVPSFIGLFDRNESKVGNFVVLVIGILLLFGARGIIGFDLVFKLMVPFALVMIGLSFIFNDFIKKSVTDRVSKVKVGDDAIVATFAEQKVNFDKQEFKDTAVEAIFGSVNLDLRDAKIGEDVAIKVTSIFGGVDIILPIDANVKIKSTPIFGGVSNKIVNKESNKKTIYIDATALFGGVTIK